MKELFKKKTASTAVTSVILIIIGLMLIIRPIEWVAFLCRIVGILLLVSGIFRTAASLMSLSIGGGAGLITGLIRLFLGGWITARAENFVAYITIVLGFIVLLHGFEYIQNGLALKRSGYSYWGVLIAIAAVMLALGIFVMVSPFSAVAITLRIAGTVLIIDGVTTIAAAARLKKFVQSMQEKSGIIETTGEDVSD
jgi:uncharacterized membrane protein HdeD (DUF308 family)